MTDRQLQCTSATREAHALESILTVDTCDIDAPYASSVIYHRSHSARPGWRIVQTQQAVETEDARWSVHYV